MTLHNFRLIVCRRISSATGGCARTASGHIPWRGVLHRCYRGSALGSAVLATSLAFHRGLGTFDGVSRYLAVSDFVRRKHVEAGIDHPRSL